ncbi:MAG: hypothetical protein LBK98_01115, partial [Peptococcaceae bacterium]|nr:hypothetical protein [Peptococcaceae bacterium]
MRKQSTKQSMRQLTRSRRPPARRRGFSRRALSAALAALMILTLLPAAAPQAVVAADALEPSILRQPADATYAENATARFYVAASSPEGGYLTYQWYRSGPFASEVADPNGAGQNAIVNATTVGSAPDVGDSATSAVLTTTTPAPADAGSHWYYYWAEITNHVTDESNNVSNQKKITTRIAAAKIVDRTLKDRVMNGDFQAYTSTITRLNTYPPAAGYWDTTHEGTPDTRQSSTGKQLEIGKGYLSANTTTAAELAAFADSTLYQDIATVPGKIYEWKLDHGARTRQVGSANPDVMAVVIGPAINEESDYAAMGVFNYWNKVSPTEFNNRNINTSTSSGLPSGAFIFSYGASPTYVAPPLTQAINGGDYAYGVNMYTHFNAIVQQVMDDPANHITQADYLAKTFNDAERSYSTIYGGKPYYVFISSSPRDNKFYTRSGSYTVPAGQGTTVFGFVSIYRSMAAAGNILDNITFASGSTLYLQQEISYTGETELSVSTRSGFAYGLTELRGSSAITLYDAAASYDPDGAGATAPTPDYPTTAGLGDGEQWYAGLSDGGALTCSGLTPGKTSRVVGVPVAAINEGLGTTIYPADVLDEGYYSDVKILPAKSADDTAIAAVTAGLDGAYAFVAVENSRNDAQYALLPAVGAAGAELPDKGSDAAAIWVDGGGDLRFPNLVPNTVYYLAARPFGYNEVTYGAAAYNPDGGVAAVRVATPAVSGGGGAVAGVDLAETQVSRGAAGTSISVTGATAGYTYALVDPASGAILQAQTAASDGAAITFTGLESGLIYQAVTRPAAGVYMKGVRVYPYPGELEIDYAGERARPLGGGSIPAPLSYSFDGGANWAQSAGAGYISLTAALNGSSGPGALSYRLAGDAYAGAAAYPTRELPFPARPVLSELAADYEAETLMIGIDGQAAAEGSPLEYRAGSTGSWGTATLGDGGLIPLAALGWHGAARSVSSRAPAAAGGGSFASTVTTTSIPARLLTPTGLGATVSGSYITFSGLGDSVTDYVYSVDAGATWAPVAPSLGLFTVGDYDAGTAYQFRRPATAAAPASLAVTVRPLPITLEAADFGAINYDHTANLAGAFIGSITVKNVSALDIGNVEFALPDVALDDEGDFRVLDHFHIDPASAGPIGGGQSVTVGVYANTTLGAGTYIGPIEATYYDPGDDYNQKTSEAAARLVVNKAEWDMGSAPTVSGVTDSGFTVSLPDAPAGATLDWYLGEAELALNGGPSQALTGLSPQSAYTLEVSARGDENHNPSEPRSIGPIYTAMAAPAPGDVVRIDYINETLLLRSGHSADDYAVTVAGGGGPVPINHMDPVTPYADTGFTLSVVRKGAPTGDPTTPAYPDSAPASLTVTGRAAAPAVTARYATTDQSADGGLAKAGGGAFQYRLSGSGNGGWQNVNNQINTLRTGLYDARLAPTTAAFASKIKEKIDVQYSSLAVGFNVIAIGGADGKAATTGLLITFDREVTGLTAAAVKVEGAAQATIVTNYGDSDAKTWRVNVNVAVNNATATVTVNDWAYGGQNYTVKSPTSQSVTVYAPVPEDKPAVAINYQTEELTGLKDGRTYKFSVSGVGSGTFDLSGQTTFPIRESWMSGGPNEVTLVLAGGANTVDSQAQKLTIPQRPAAPTITDIKPSAIDGGVTGDGIITVDGGGLEYQKVGDLTWTGVPADNKIKVLPTGAYFIRMKATAASFHGNPSRAVVHLTGTHDFGEVYEGYGTVTAEKFEVKDGVISNAALEPAGSTDYYNLDTPDNVTDMFRTVGPKNNLLAGIYAASLKFIFSDASFTEFTFNFAVHKK